MYKILYNEERRIDMLGDEDYYFYNEAMVEFIASVGGWTIEDGNYPGVVYAGTREEAEHDLFVNENNPDYYDGECLIVLEL